MFFLKSPHHHLLNLLSWLVLGKYAKNMFYGDRSESLARFILAGTEPHHRHSELKNNPLSHPISIYLYL